MNWLFFYYDWKFRLNNTQSHFEVGILHSTRCVCTIIPLLSTHVNEKYRWWLSYHMGLQDFNGTWQGINCQVIVEERWWQIRIYNSLTSYELRHHFRFNFVHNLWSWHLVSNYHSFHRDLSLDPLSFSINQHNTPQRILPKLRKIRWS